MKKKVIFFVVAILMFNFSFGVDFSDARIESGPLAVCGNGICEGGQGELNTCPQDCEQQTCDPANGNECKSDPCTIAKDPLGSICVIPNSQLTGTCQFKLDTSCTMCADNGNSKFYGAWGDYNCRNDGLTTGNSCVNNLAVPSNVNFNVNSCDGSQDCCTTGQSSCIGNDQCGSYNQATNQIVNNQGITYAGGTQGYCREKCTTAGACRVVNGQGQKCVSCSYRPDTLWKQDFPSATLWSVTHVASGVWINDNSCNQQAQCVLPDNCASSTTNGLAKPALTCSAGLTCVTCNNGYYFDSSSKICKPSCATLRGNAAGGCSISMQLPTSIGFSYADATDINANCATPDPYCIKCSTGYNYDANSRICVLGCKQQEEICTGSVSVSNCCATDSQNRKLYCSKGTDGQSTQGYCCPEGQYFDGFVCQPTFLCLESDCSNSLTNPLSFLTAPDSYLTPNKLYFLGKSQNLNRCVIETKAYQQACVMNSNLGPSPFRVYGPIHVLDVNGNRVS